MPVENQKMSRSYKKNNWVKDSSNSANKKLSSRKFRRTTNQRLKRLVADPYQDINLFNKSTEAMDNWNVCDYKFLIDEEKYGLKGKQLKLFK